MQMLYHEPVQERNHTMTDFSGLAEAFSGLRLRDWLVGIAIAATFSIRF